jgi:bacteriocin biosynthesis cyclodehydratase domain-containing protein
VKSTAEIVEVADGLVLLRPSGVEVRDLKLEGDPGLLRCLLDALDGERLDTEVGAHLRAAGHPAGDDDVAGALAELVACGVVEDAAADAALLSPGALARFDRQLRFFGDLVAPGDPRALAQARLAEATVAVLGLGGLGGMAALLLAACGVGRIVGVDDDRVDTSNLARQVLYGERDIGRPKVDVAAERLVGLNGACAFAPVAQRLGSEEDVAQAIAGADVVVAAVDWPAGRIARWVNAACFAAGIPYVSMSQHPPSVRIGPTYVPGETGCFACQEAGYRHGYPLYDQALAAIADDSPAATYAPACGVIGSLVANEVVGLLTGLPLGACRGRSAVMDLGTLELRYEPVVRDPGCAVCGAAAMSSGRTGGPRHHDPRPLTDLHLD